MVNIYIVFEIRMILKIIAQKPYRVWFSDLNLARYFRNHIFIKLWCISLRYTEISKKTDSMSFAFVAWNAQWYCCVECCYLHFCKLVPNDIFRPMPQDLGTCLCQTCLSPQLKMEAFRKVDKSLFVEAEKLIKYDESKLKAFCEKVKTCKKTVRYLYWSKGKKESENSVTETHMSCNKVKCCSSQESASDLLVNLKALREHTERMISQYRWIKEIKKIVSGDSQKSLSIRVDWSQNGNLFQARQEKGAYYHELQVSINAAVAYMSTDVSSHCTIFDTKSHKAPAVWTLLEKILGSFDLDRL